MSKYQLFLTFLIFFGVVTNGFGETCICPKGGIVAYAKARYDYADQIVLARIQKTTMPSDTKICRMTVDILETFKGSTPSPEEIIYDCLYMTGSFSPKTGETKLFILKNNQAHTCPNDLCSFAQEAVVHEFREISKAASTRGQGGRP